MEEDTAGLCFDVEVVQREGVFEVEGYVCGCAGFFEMADLVGNGFGLYGSLESRQGLIVEFESGG